MLHAPTNYFVQPKLAVNTPGDIYEQEADAMADRVMRMSSNKATKPVTGLIGKSLQRKCAHCEDEEKKRKPVMRKADSGNSGMAVSSSFAASLHASKGGGSPLSQGTKNFMENAFSADFSSVKVHTDSMASEMSSGINAKAFTHGNDIYFGAGQYSPNTYSGGRLLAHELTHIVQQNKEVKSVIQRTEISDGRPTGWEDWYEFVQEAANNFYEKALKINTNISENRANRVHSCIEEDSNYGSRRKLKSCNAENPSNKSESPQVKVVWWQELGEVNVIKGTYSCKYSYKNVKGRYVFEDLNACHDLAKV